MNDSFAASSVLEEKHALDVEHFESVKFKNNYPLLLSVP